MYGIIVEVYAHARELTVRELVSPPGVRHRCKQCFFTFFILVKFFFTFFNVFYFPYVF